MNHIKLLHCHLINRKSHKGYLESNPGLRGEKPSSLARELCHWSEFLADNVRSYSTTTLNVLEAWCLRTRVILPSLALRLRVWCHVRDSELVAGTPSEGMVPHGHAADAELLACIRIPGDHNNRRSDGQHWHWHVYHGAHYPRLRRVSCAEDVAEAAERAGAAAAAGGEQLQVWVLPAARFDVSFYLFS